MLIRLAVCALSLSACRQPTKADGAADIVAVVNNEPIFVKRLQQQLSSEHDWLQALPAEERLAAVQRDLDGIIDLRLMRQRAEAAGVKLDHDVIAARMRAMFPDDGAAYPEGYRWEVAAERAIAEHYLAHEVLERVAVSEDAIKQAYESDPSAYESPARMRVFQILVREESLARDLRGRIARGQPIQKLARDHSIGPEANRGGDMGTIQEGQLPPALDSVLKTAPLRQPVLAKTEFGHHILVVAARQPKTSPTFSTARLAVESKLLAAAKLDAQQAFFDELRRASAVQINHSVLQQVVLSVSTRTP